MESLERTWQRCKTMREIRAEQRGEVVEFFEPVQIIYPKPIQPDRIVWDGDATIGSIRIDDNRTKIYLRSIDK